MSFSRWTAVARRVQRYLAWRAQKAFTLIRWYIEERFYEAYFDYGTASRQELIEGWAQQTPEEIEFEAHEFQELLIEEGELAEEFRV